MAGYEVYSVTAVSKKRIGGKLMKINEDNFVEQLKFRNEKALEYVIDNYGRIVKSIVKKHLFSLQDYQEECINDVFLAVWENIESYRPMRSSFVNWIAGIARYKAIDYKRKYLKRIQTENLEDVTAGEEDREQMKIIEEELSEEMEEMLSCLSPEDRELFMKLYVEEMEPEEVSRQTGMKKDVIYNRVSRGRRKIRKLFSTQKGEKSYEQ